MPSSLIIDTDAGIDDLLAIAYLITQPSVTIEAITVVNGLAHVPYGARNILRLLQVVNLQDEIPVYLGAQQHMPGGTDFDKPWRKTADDLGSEVGLPETSAQPKTDAIGFLAKRFSSSTPFTLLAIGPHTNLATALQQNGGTYSAVSAMPMMGGAVFVSGNVNQNGNTKAEWNMYEDPLAASITFTSGLPIGMVPLDATNQVPITQAYVNQATSTLTSPLGVIVAKLLALGYQTNGNQDGDYFAWDPLAGMSVVVPTVVGSGPQPITLVTPPSQQAGWTQPNGDTPHQVGVATTANASLWQSTFLAAFQ